ncbi:MULTISPECIES: hypothetical protein [Microbacterium]|uniref:hypothetical protein n=1 Tax=Microbacterium TaxID=33882 RepID=UPI001E3D9B74|nr:hypothetical protein [Microbacterium nymphoidis]MCD2498372.1 hypothetical protein [Microbacterium nymphoidis]
MSDAPDLGLLLDVDGPIASPVSRTIAIPTIIDDLIALTAAGVPIAFVTGRSDAFIDAQVVAPLMAHGLADALRVPGARMFGVFEKGAVWAPIDENGLGEITVDESVAFRPADIAAIRELAEGTYGDTMFFDETKRAMISVEQRTDVDSARYYAAQSAFQNDAYALLTGRGVGLRYGEREQADNTGAVPFRVDPTVISTDIESVLLDKDRGAVRALEHFAERGPLPRTWRSVGDSRSDYKMADQLHADGFEVAHVDVRPSDGVLDKPYRVIVEGDLIHDEAGAAFLRHWRTRFGL